MSFAAHAPAKLNLTLEVGPLAADGYHPLRSVFLRIGLSDRLRVAQYGVEADRLVVEGIDGVPQQGNLVLRAADLLRRRVGLQLPALDIVLEKHIPLQAGLAGGSSDAAAMLGLAAACWGVGLSLDERLALATMLGSDVPFFVTGASVALIEGRGEVVDALPPVNGRPGVLLCNPALAIQTARAFAVFDELGHSARKDSPTDELVAALRNGLAAGDLVDWTARLHGANDLWAAAVRLEPALDALRDELERLTGRPWMLTGSGSSLFTFYASAEEAADAGRHLVERQPAGMAGARIYATDLEGPDPSWRQA